MKTTDIQRRLVVIEGLLRERRFDLALALAGKLEDTVTALHADTCRMWRVPSGMRDRLAAARSAAEVGSQLGQVAVLNALQSFRRRARSAAWRKQAFRTG